MAICYKKLWKMLINRDMQKKDLRMAAGLLHISCFFVHRPFTFS